MKTNEQRWAKHSSSQPRITYHCLSSSCFSISLLPSFSLRKYYKATQKDSRHSNEKHKSVALFVLLSRHWQLIPQRWLAGSWCYNTNAKASNAWTLPINLNVRQALFPTLFLTFTYPFWVCVCEHYASLWSPRHLTEKFRLMDWQDFDFLEITQSYATSPFKTINRERLWWQCVGVCVYVWICQCWRGLQCAGLLCNTDDLLIGFICLFSLM